MAAALAALWLPTRPEAAISLLAGQALAAVNFFFLSRLVKPFTEAAFSPSRAEATLLRGKAGIAAGAKLIVVYGGAFALTRWRGLELLPALLGFSLSLLALFLDAVGSALVALGGRGRRAAPGGEIRTKVAGVVALLLACGATFAPAAWADEGGMEHLPNWLTILNDYLPHNPVVHWMYENEYLVFAWLAGLVFLGFTWVAMRRPSIVPGPLQNALEWMVESMEDVCGGMLGKHLDRYFPFIIAVFFYVLTMNLIGIIPGFKSSTSTLDVTLALALITFVYVQFEGIRNLGILGYIDHLAGSPRDIVGFVMLPVMIPVHVLGELAKPVSLSCRLFGNIFGEDTLIVVFVGATALCIKASLVALAIPPMLGISALFMLLQALTSIVQALIFSLLATVYLYMMLPHEEHGHGEAEAAHAS
jgi:F-type H+-transporting ATPase subunit a